MENEKPTHNEEVLRLHNQGKKLQARDLAKLIADGNQFRSDEIAVFLRAPRKGRPSLTSSEKFEKQVDSQLLDACWELAWLMRCARVCKKMPLEMDDSYTEIEIVNVSKLKIAIKKAAVSNKKLTEEQLTEDILILAYEYASKNVSDGVQRMLRIEKRENEDPNISMAEIEDQKARRRKFIQQCTSLKFSNLDSLIKKVSDQYRGVTANQLMRAYKRHDLRAYWNST